MSPFDRSGVAERLRSLIDGQAELDRLAERLGVEELSLRLSIDADSPHPTIEVLAAFVRELGLDPNWLLTGVYDASTHRSVMDDDRRARDALRALMGERMGRIAEPADERPKLNE